MSVRTSRGVVGGAVAAGGVLVAGAAVAGAVTTSAARRMLGSAHRPPATTTVLDLDVLGGRVVLEPTEDALLPGVYSFWFEGARGHLRIGEVLERRSDAVVRALLDVEGDPPEQGSGRFNGWVYLTPDDLDVFSDEVRLQTTVGAAPAWEVPADGFDSPRWAVLVHGRSSVRQEALRAVPAFHAAGWSTLLPSYRDDGEAPASPSSRYGFDDGAWLDVETAVLHALDQGAREVVLMGWSTGADLVLQTAARSRLASVLSGIVLESPVLDAAAAVAHAAGADRLPAPVRRGAFSLAASRLGARVLGDDEPLERPRTAGVRPDALRLPMLVLHGDDDGRAPFEASRRLAEERQDLVTLVPFAGGRHTRLWNQDRARWETAVTAWLRGDRRVLGSLVGQPPRRQPRRSQRA